MRPRTPVLVGLLALAASAAVAQEGPPPVLAVTREEIKPGKMSAHEKQAASYVALLAKASPESYRIGLTPVSGDENVVMYLQGYPSFAAVEASRNQMGAAIATNAAWKTEMDRIESQGGELHASQKSALFRYRSDLSYRPMKVNDVAQARFMSVTTVRIKPGRVPDYVDLVKDLNAAREKAGIDIHGVVYQVDSGVPNNTFLIITSNRSLGEVDDGYAKFDERQKAITAALGGDEVMKQRRMLASEIIAESYTNVYAMAPTISRPSPQFAAADPDFWAPKPAVAASAKATATKKEAPKP